MSSGGSSVGKGGRGGNSAKGGKGGNGTKGGKGGNNTKGKAKPGKQCCSLGTKWHKKRYCFAALSAAPGRQTC
ncbi:hypothetical protein CN153_21650 [Sinorhizobium meliloti]|nr:hypothetical protein DA102_023830 [Sinorhizobium meliloti]RVE92028.1 hypothetical protein CN238_04745 [Sinorhizobium meliloti]RVG58954.1 hypothetical protein CN220_33740 [Sinorhizobium meliloti]RVH35241.1 hypothetical protein CN214_04060 [Sinorhizobium meliloti]RVH91351.1 hypothetical protein CN199_23695 [Sinorhizobium meliloti]